VSPDLEVRDAVLLLGVGFEEHSGESHFEIEPVGRLRKLTNAA